MRLLSGEAFRSDVRPLSSGVRVARYEIMELVGRGGMGIVYRARDVELQRDVALKCPARRQLESDSRRRFMREARASAALACPYIVPVFEVFEYDDLPWIAMEYIEGVTLRERLETTGGLGALEILRYSEHLATALQSAHSKHILHRDVKPANVMITADGRARLMDFGLARCWAPPGEGELRATDSGSITRDRLVGTALYMSPEQVLGRELDPRSDIFSLGAVMYEMVTARALFGCSQFGSVIDAILHGEPGPIVGADGDLPASFEPIIRRAIAKNPAERYQTAMELVEDLRALRHRFEFAKYHPSEETTRLDSAVLPRDRRRVRRGLVAALGAAVVLCAGVAISWWLGGTTVADGRAYRARALVTWPTAESDAQLSPDGEWLTFVSDRDGGTNIWIGRLAGGAEPVRLTSDDAVIMGHAWSRAGDEVVYLTHTDPLALKFVPAPVPGAVRRTVPLRLGHPLARLVRWVGPRIYLESRGELWRHDLTDGSTTNVVARYPDLEGQVGYDVDLAERSVVFAGRQQGAHAIWVVDLSGGLPRRVLDGTDDHGPVWGDDAAHTILFSSNRTGQNGLWRTTVDGGSPEPLPLNAPVLAISAVALNGAAVLATLQRNDADIWVWDATSRRERPVTADTRNDHGVTKSAQHPRLALQRSETDQAWLSTSVASQLVVGRWTGSRLDGERIAVNEAFGPELSADGRWLAYRRSTSGGVLLELWVQDVDAGQETRISERLFWNGFYPSPADDVSRDLVWSHDGAVLFFLATDDAGAPAILQFRPGVGTRPEVLSAPARHGDRIMHLTPSRDGQRLAYVLQTGPAIDPDILPDVRELDLRTGADRSIYFDAAPVRPVGWLRGDLELILLRATVNADFSQSVELLAIDRRGNVRELGRHDSAFGWTAVLDADRGTVYLTCRNGSLHDLCGFSVEQKSWQIVTSNAYPDATFSALELLDDGSLLFTRRREICDLWALLAED